MSKRKLSPAGLLLTLDKPLGAANPKYNPVHVNRKLLTRKGTSRAICGHSSNMAYVFPFLWWIYDNAPICPECKKRAGDMGLSNGA